MLRHNLHETAGVGISSHIMIVNQLGYTCSQNIRICNYPEQPPCTRKFMFELFVYQTQKFGARDFRDMWPLAANTLVLYTGIPFTQNS